MNSLFCNPCSCNDGNNFFNKWRKSDVEITESHMKVGDHIIMYDWERPLMKKIAEIVTINGGDILEVGFGMGIASTYIQEFGARSHTILEPHPGIAEVAKDWRKRYSSPIVIIEDFWQKCYFNLNKFDAIMFDPVEEKSFREDTFTFLKIAAKHLLRTGGSLAVFYPFPTLNKDYQLNILNYYDHLSIYSVRGLEPTPDFAKRGIIDTMIIPVAYI